MTNDRRQIRIVYEDDHLIVIDKPGGLLTMSTGKEGETTAYSILTDYVRSGDKDRGHSTESRVFIVHRLDRYTSGLLVFAKDPQTKYTLQDNWNDSVLERIYVAIVEGIPEIEEGTIESWLCENMANHMVYSAWNGEESGGKLAITNYRVLDTCRMTLESGVQDYSLVEFDLETGRKNQIRVHASDIGHPIAGDTKYGAKTNPLHRLALHARKLAFIHPVTGEKLYFDTGTPLPFRRMFKRSRNDD